MIEIIKSTSRDIYNAFSGLAFYVIIATEQTWNYVLSFFWTPQELMEDICKDSPARSPEIQPTDSTGGPAENGSNGILSTDGTKESSNRRSTLELLGEFYGGVYPFENRSNDETGNLSPLNLLTLLDAAGLVFEAGVSGGSPDANMI